MSSTLGPLAAHAGPYLKLVLPAKFYNVPLDAPAVFSTRNGTRAKRQLLSPPPAPIVRSDFDQEVKRMAALLRQELPQVAGLIRNPTSWKDLYYFFDAVDLWVEGTVFLYYVVSHISKENQVAHDSYTRMNQNAMIFQYAGNWVANNADRIATLPSETEFTTHFNQSQKGDICGMKDYELETMKQALRFHHARLLEKYNAVAQAQRVDAVQQPISHPTHGFQQNLAPAMQHAQPVPIVDRKDQYHHKIVPVHPIAHPPQTYSHFMEAQRTVTNVLASPPKAPAQFHKDNNSDQHCARARGYSGDAGRNSHSLPKGRPSYGNENHTSVNNQRLINSAPRHSPPRPTPYANQPIYVHNSQCVSPPHGRETMVHARTFSDSQTGRTGVSNDARVWNTSAQFPRRQSGSSHESLEKPGSGPQPTGYHQRSRSIPFQGHPHAKITDKSCTFFYKKEFMDQKSDPHDNRTLYVYGAAVEMFSSHTLKNMMSEVGTVESISYLYSNSNMGPAFITFTEESALAPAMARFDGITLPTGRRMEVKLPDKARTSRDRSDSQSSQTYYPNHSSSYPARQNHRNFRKNSISSRPYNRSHRSGDAIKSQNHSPEGHRYQSGDWSSLTHNFQAQLNVSPPFSMPVPVENFQSSISEILNHQLAMERLRVAQMPLETIDNYSGGNRKSNGPSHEKSRWNKENSPIKDAPKNTTRVVTPKKEQMGIYSDGNGNGANKGQENNVLTQNIPRLSTSDLTLVKSHSISDLVEGLRASARQRSPAVSPNSNHSKAESKSCDNGPPTEPEQTCDFVEALRATARQRSPAVSPNSNHSKAESKFCDNGPPTEPKQTCDFVEVLRASASQIIPAVSPNSNHSRAESKSCDNGPLTDPGQTCVQNVTPVDANSGVRIPMEVDASTMTIGNREISPDSENAPKARKLKKNKQKQNNFKREASSSSTATATASAACVDTSSPTLSDTTSYKSATTSFSEASSRNHSFASAKSTASLSTANSSFKEKDPQSTPTHVNKYSTATSSSSSSRFPTPKAPSSRHQHRSRDSKNKAKSGKSDDKKLDGETSKPAQGIPCSEGDDNIDDTITPFQDPKQWPALERNKTASSKIVDGKPPVIASLPPHNTSSGAKNSIVIVPALPLNMISHRRNSGEVAETRSWPRVRNYVGK